jgi:hydroxyethylthiazole kinase-like uncharacterized protein yjeF
VLCGPGNNGGDGYVIARALAERGVRVRVAAMTEPKGEAAAAARQAWHGPVERLDEAAPAPLLIDSLFGTGLARPLDSMLVERLGALAAAARVRVAIDLPSGIATDDGCVLCPVPDFDLTVTFQTLKPSHLLQPAAQHMGRIVVADIGIDAASDLNEIGRPKIATPGPDDHKYTRGYVLIVGGAMPGASALAARAAAQAGAGYVVLIGEGGVLPDAIIRRPEDALKDALTDTRIGAVLIGPGLGRGRAAVAKLENAMTSLHPVVLDGDGLGLLGNIDPRDRYPTIATPHAGEFARAYGDGGDKISAARAAAARERDVIVYKGADTVVAAPDGRAAILSVPHWLASAGTGDVLAGIVAARYAAHGDAFAAACEAVWLHGRAAELAGSALIADDLIRHLPAALADCL